MNVKRLIKEYWDSRSDTYDRSPGHVCLPGIWRSILESVFDSKMRILDVGTGTGFLALILAELGHEVVGLDISEGMLKVAKMKAKKRGLKVQFKLGDAENLPFKDESFDAIVCRHLLWTLPNPKKALAEWVRVAKEKIVVVDGRWGDKSLGAKFRRLFGRILIGVYERRNPFKQFHYKREINNHLPFYGGTDLNALIEIVESLNLKTRVWDLAWLREMQIKSLPLPYRIAWTKKEYYMVECFKNY